MKTPHTTMILFALLFLPQSYASAQEVTPQASSNSYISANAQRLCRQIAGMTIEQAIAFLNKSPLGFTLKKCSISISGFSSYQQDSSQPLLVPAPPPMGRYYPLSPRGGFYGN
jgi:hypothetical protein